MNVHEQGPSIAIVGEEGLYHREPTTFGVPFAEGTLTDASSVRMDRTCRCRNQGQVTSRGISKMFS